MSYQTALTIADVIDNIHKKKYLLPSIQREFVWDTYKIERLFDSLMREYPINAFLFWEIEKSKIHEFEFYEFLRDYHERDHRHNPKASLTGEDKLIAILDGQQRLTSLYIGLRGSFAYKLPKKKRSNDQAYPKRNLYMNLIKKPEDIEQEYDFQFLTSTEANEKNENFFWFKVGDILNLKDLASAMRYINEKDIPREYSKEKSDFAIKALSQLFQIIHVKPAISYYLEKENILDKVLQIFIRINSGGAILSYSDLLLSIATATWKDRDAREEIIEFVDSINKVGESFNFNKDFVLKTCLVLSDFNDIAFKVDNFNNENMTKIGTNWENIIKAIRIAVNLVSSFGYSRETLTSANAIIPIAYYIKKIGLPENFVESSKTLEDKINIKKWLGLSLLKKVFSGQSDNILRQIRKILQEHNDNIFPIDKIIDKFAGTNKTIIFTEEDIDNILSYQYGQSFTFSVLTMIYPSFDYRNIFHVDHIYPKSLFSKRKLRKLDLSEDKIDKYIAVFNSLPNLQLLEGIPNIEKQDNEFEKWLKTNCKTDDDFSYYRKLHYIPRIDLGIENFLEFIEQREELIKTKLKSVLLQ